jgi:hypothetical protein
LPKRLLDLRNLPILNRKTFLLEMTFRLIARFNSVHIAWKLNKADFPTRRGIVDFANNVIVVIVVMMHTISLNVASSNMIDVHYCKLLLPSVLVFL